MSRIFKRPMFRKGGNVGEGIMTGIVDREMHAESDPNGVGGQTLSTAERLQKISDKYPDQSIDPIAQLLIQGGLGAMSTTGGGSTIGNLAKAFKDPTDQLFKNLNNRGKDKRNLAIEGAILDIEQAGKEALLEKELNFKRQGELDENSIDKIIENQALKLSIENNTNLLDEERKLTWQLKTTKNLQKQGKKIGGLLSQTDLKNESKFAKKLIKKGKKETIFYDPYNNRVLEVGTDENGEPALIEIQTDGTSKIKSKVPVVPEIIKNIETNPSYMRPSKPDVVTPFIKKKVVEPVKGFMKNVEEQEGPYGTGA